MKTKLLLTAAISIISFGAFSQSLKIGAKGGATMNKITGQTFKEQFSYGYHIGGFATIGLSKNLLFNPKYYLTRLM